MSDAIYLDQTLHGYADGHQLLATSADLTSEQQSLLLIMSDLSGPAFRSGYESYLTGYPLSNGAIYCLARTWFAPEMPRPGCVWTQTLLIKAEDLARIFNFDGVNQMFHRPAEPSEIGAYCRRLSLDQKVVASERILVDPRATLVALYDGGKKVVLPSESSQPLEPLLLAVFEQQWPKLRRGFRFCSGALSLRDADFDLSVSPPEATHSLSPQGVLVFQNAARGSLREDWLDVADRDLVAADRKSPFREFLWRFGPDMAAGRSAFRPLTEIYCLLRAEDREGSAERLLSAIGHFYPQPEDAGRLKANIFGAGSEYAARGGNEADILRLLISHPLASSISATIADIRVRANSLAKSHLSAAIGVALLASQLGGEYAQQFLDGFVENEEWSPEFLEKAPLELLSVLLGKHPNLVVQGALWSQNDRMDVIGKVLLQLNGDSDLLRKTISSMMDVGAWDALSRLISFCGSDAVRVMFNLVDADASEIIDYPDTIYSDLSRRNDSWMELMQSSQLGVRAVALLSADLDPRSWYVRRVGLASWTVMLNANVHFATPERALRSSIFTLSVGLSSWDHKAARFVAKSLAAVYAAAAENQIGEGLWQQLEPNLSWYSPSWDKCARLVRSAARAFKDRSWPLQEFFATFRSEHLLSLALREIADTYGGYRFIKEVKEQAVSGSIAVSAEQLAVMDRF